MTQEVNASDAGMIQETCAVHYYSYVWGFLDVLSRMPDHQREMLVIGQTPWGENALVVSVLGEIQIVAEIDGEEVGVNSILVPEQLHVLPFAALQSEGEDRDIMRMLRAEFHKTTGSQSNSKQGQRLLDLFMMTTRRDLDEWGKTVQGEAESQLRELQSVSVGDVTSNLIARRTVEAIDQRLAELNRVRMAFALRDLWRTRGE